MNPFEISIGDVIKQFNEALKYKDGDIVTIQDRYIEAAIRIIVSESEKINSLNRIIKKNESDKDWDLYPDRMSGSGKGTGW